MKKKGLKMFGKWWEIKEFIERRTTKKYVSLTGYVGRKMQVFSFLDG